MPCKNAARLCRIGPIFCWLEVLPRLPCFCAKRCSRDVFEGEGLVRVFFGFGHDCAAALSICPPIQRMTGTAMLFDVQFKQVVIFGRRIRQREKGSDAAKTTQGLLLQIGQGDIEAEVLPQDWPLAPCIVPASPAEPEHFYRVTLEPAQFADEVGKLQGLWPMLDTHLGAAQQSMRPPARALSQWHLALALAAGAISGVVRSKTGKVMVVKGAKSSLKCNTLKMRSCTHPCQRSLLPVRTANSRASASCPVLPGTPPAGHQGCPCTTAADLHSLQSSQILQSTPAVMDTTREGKGFSHVVGMGCCTSD